jgi:hypothetical protein
MGQQDDQTKRDFLRVQEKVVALAARVKKTGGLLVP